MPAELKKVKVPLDRSLYLLHPCNSFLITSKNKTGKPNIMTVAWITPVSAKPPLLAMSIRPERYSYNLIMESREFVVNIPTFDLTEQVLFCGRRSGREHNKLRATALHTQKALKVRPPAIKECIGHLECKVVNTMEAGDHTLIIGEIIEAYATKGHFDQIYNIQKPSPLPTSGQELLHNMPENQKRT